MPLISALFERNTHILNSRHLWQWGSRSLHPRWERIPKYRGTCLMAIAFAVDQGEALIEAKTHLFHIPEVYGAMSGPLVDNDGLSAWWDSYPHELLQLALGLLTQGHSLAEPLEKIRRKHGINKKLDSLAKRMQRREEAYGDDWTAEGYHPEAETAAFDELAAPFFDDTANLLLENLDRINDLAAELLRQGPWSFQQPPLWWFVRKTPEKLLNKIHRLTLWKAAQKVLFLDLEHNDKLRKLCEEVHGAVTPSIRSEVESQRYEIEDVVRDMLNFDMHKTREALLA